MSEFYNSLHSNDRRPALPVNNTRTQHSVNEIMTSTTNKIEAAKQDLYEKIDVCCAQYGLYGLNVISKAISESLSRMISGINTTSTPKLVVKRPLPVVEANTQESTPDEELDENFEEEQPRARFGSAQFTNDFMSNIDKIFEACDEDSNAKAEQQMKARLLEQKQIDMLAEQARASAKQMTENDIESELNAAQNDFNLVQTENLHNV